MARRAKLTQEMVDEAIRLKADGLSNGDIICALGIHESTFCRWIGDPKNKLQRELSEGLKKEESAFKRTLLTTIRSAALARHQVLDRRGVAPRAQVPRRVGRAERKSNMRRLSYEWLAGLREICIDPERCPLTYEEFRLKEYDRDRDGTWLDEIPDGNDHSIDAVRYAMMDDVLRG